MKQNVTTGVEIFRSCPYNKDKCDTPPTPQNPYTFSRHVRVFLCINIALRLQLLF